jgi:hypothetical protein
MSTQLTLGIDAPPPKRERATLSPKIAPPHVEARRLGVIDGTAGLRRSAQRWPSGTYGHADYELGFAEGERQRDEGAVKAFVR